MWENFSYKKQKQYYLCLKHLAHQGITYWFQVIYHILSLQKELDML